MGYNSVAGKIMGTQNELVQGVSPHGGNDGGVYFARQTPCHLATRGGRNSRSLRIREADLEHQADEFDSNLSRELGTGHCFSILSADVCMRIRYFIRTLRLALAQLRQRHNALRIRYAALRDQNAALQARLTAIQRQVPPEILPNDLRELVHGPVPAAAS
ncbi:hypothetical protein PAPYR_2508 [Paratrimastix pyriformis]|uniref:Uncharacterized protein n=1 Tax=Paratrimastix pyriformis TaxID=342808 RepID=A0ABQ8UPG1_9EUKA|nr:hypothetical protein PAPYR_2508 [Paratrimastix pyriformis]